MKDPTKYCPLSQKWLFPEIDCKYCMIGVQLPSKEYECAIKSIAVSLSKLHRSINLLQSNLAKMEKQMWK